MELTRKQIIDNLSYIADSMPDDACAEWRDSLAYAISSLKTDEMYQLDYEGVKNIVVTEGMTNGDVIKQMFPKTPIGVSLDVYGDTGEIIFTTDSKWWNSPYKGVKDE